MKKNIFLIFCLSIFFGCFFYILIHLINYIGTSDVIVPPQPLNLPSDAFWQGGIDGGYWYSCKKSRTDFEFHCKLYGDDGNVVIKDSFELYISLYGKSKEISMKDFRKQTYLTADNVIGFNGSSDIYMQGSLVLKAKNHTLDDLIIYEVNDK